MKNVLTYIFEASSKPSDLKKFTDKSKTVDVLFKSGDIYDLSDDGYVDKFRYYSGEGNGYIKDKQGNVYDVEASERQGDAGRIAGGSTHLYVKIFKANGKDDFVVTGYMGIMTQSTNPNCIGDIKCGHYLEDYIAKYITNSQQDKFGDIAAKGDKNAKSFEQGKADRKDEKYAQFLERYARIPNRIPFEITSEGLQFIGWRSFNQSAEYKELQQKMSALWKKSGRTDEYTELERQADDIANKTVKLIHDTFRPTVEKMVQYIFKSKDIKSLAGIAGQVVYEKAWVRDKRGDKEDDFAYAIDTKKKEVVKVQWNDTHKRAKISDYHVDLYIADNIKINKKHMTPKTEKLFKAVAQAWKKNHAGKQGEYIKNNWERIQREGGGYWSWKKSNGQAKAEAKAEYQELLRKHSWEDNNELEFSLSLIKLYIEGDIDPDQGPVEKPLENPVPSGEKKERGKDTKMSNGAKNAAYDKMQQWHDGKRKQNLSNCSDAKLKMNYKVCKELGFEKEMDLLKQEAEKRNINIDECMSLSQFIILCESYDED